MTKQILFIKLILLITIGLGILSCEKKEEEEKLKTGHWSGSDISFDIVSDTKITNISYAFTFENSYRSGSKSEWIIKDNKFSFSEHKTPSSFSTGYHFYVEGKFTSNTYCSGKASFDILYGGGESSNSTVNWTATP